ncbi:MAG: winged helix-turn-helix transcriptional regulator [Thermoplasmatota archaeon]
MPLQIDSDSLEARLIRILMKGENITLEEAAKKLNVSKNKLERAVKSLVSKGIVGIDALPDKKYLRLKRTDLQFHGTNPSQEKALKKKKSKKSKEKGSKKSREMMYR